MKFADQPSPVGEPSISKPSENLEMTPQEKKKFFSAWVKTHIQELWSNNSDTSRGFFNDPMHEMVEKLFPNETQYISKEQTGLVKIFADELIEFCNKLIFKKDYEKNKAQSFYENLNNLYFGRSPDALEYLKTDRIYQLIAFSKINETYGLRNIVSTQGELTLDLSWANGERIEKFKENVKNLSSSSKISAIKQLSTTALWAHGNGEWAEPAYKAVVKLLLELRKNEKSPLVKFISDFELKKIENNTGIVSEFDGGVYSTPDSEDDDKPYPVNNEISMIREKVTKESTEFFNSNSIVPDLENILYSKVSKEYGSIISRATYTPYALVETTEIKNTSKRSIELQSYEGLTENKIFNPLGKEDFSHLIKVLHSPEIRDYVNKRLGIHLEDLYLREQIQFLRFLSESDEATFTKLEGQLKGNKQEINQNYLKSFLSMSGDESMGDKILTLGEKLPTESAEILFKKYGEIIDEVSSVETYMQENLSAKMTPELIDKTKEHLLLRGKKLLEIYAAPAQKCTGEDCIALGKELEQKMADIKTSTIVFAAACKSLVEQKTFSFEDFKDIELSHENASLMSEQNKNEIIAMAIENTKQYPEALREKWLGTQKDALENPKENEVIDTVKLKGEVIASMRVLRRADGSFYGASFNVNPLIKGSRVGTELLRKVIEEYTSEGDFEADVYAQNPMRDTYRESFGFEEIGTNSDYTPLGVEVIKITKWQKDRLQQAA